MFRKQRRSEPWDIHVSHILQWKCVRCVNIPGSSLTLWHGPLAWTIRYHWLGNWEWPDDSGGFIWRRTPWRHTHPLVTRVAFMKLSRPAVHCVNRINAKMTDQQIEQKTMRFLVPKRTVNFHYWELEEISRLGNILLEIMCDSLWLIDWLILHRKRSYCCSIDWLIESCSTESAVTVVRLIDWLRVAPQKVQLLLFDWLID